ncbi:MAG: pyruvate dehydrogenase (acetyl-transferring) E1 component subunit alpha [Flavobacteriales bacterium]
MATTKTKKNKSGKNKTSGGEKKKIGKETYKRWYKDMLIMRRFEERAGQLLLQGKFGGFCHLYIGQEAVVTGTVEALNKGDKFITAYRDHAHPIAVGMHPKYVMAELFGKKTGCSKGKGGSMHMFDKSRNLMGGHGIVGAQIPLGAGIAFSEQYKNTGNAVVCSMGDGAVRQGAFHETMNMAMHWKLPVVFTIENNNYAMGTAVERVSNVTDLYKLGYAYEMPSYQVDGMVCEEVYKAVDDAMKNARKGKGPTLLEINTYRYKGHSMSDPAKYRPKGELEKYKSKDPIAHIQHVIQEKGYMTEKSIKQIEKEVKEIIEESVEFADKSEFPEPEELFEDVYQQKDYPFIREY